ncbi:MAG: hypothetical protein JO149_06560 [Gammaproteobacteria bacterium]|nr:hypothetical protein [Gammaproteobacteria bacterium]
MFLQKIQNHSHRYLITSSAETFYCQQLAKEAAVWLIPKSIAKDIPITVEQPPSF